MKKLILSFVFCCAGVSLSFAQPQRGEAQRDAGGGAAAANSMLIEFTEHLSPQDLANVLHLGLVYAEQMSAEIEGGTPEGQALACILDNVERECTRSGTGSEAHNRAVNSGFRAFMRIFNPELEPFISPIEMSTDGRAIIHSPTSSHT